MVEGSCWGWVGVRNHPRSIVCGGLVPPGFVAATRYSIPPDLQPSPHLTLRISESLNVEPCDSTKLEPCDAPSLELSNSVNLQIWLAKNNRSLDNHYPKVLSVLPCKTHFSPIPELLCLLSRARTIYTLSIGRIHHRFWLNHSDELKKKITQLRRVRQRSQQGSDNKLFNSDDS
jgi:hypothetical protein